MKAIRLNIVKLVLPSFLASMFVSLNFTNNVKDIDASGLGNPIILPGSIEETGNETYKMLGQIEVRENAKNYKISMYESNQIMPTPYLVSKHDGDYYNGIDKGRCCGYEKEENTSISIGEELSATIGVSIGAEAFGVSAEASIDFTAKLGVSTSLGKGYKETLVFEFIPGVHQKGYYCVGTYVFVRKYKIVTIKEEKRVSGYKEIKNGCDVKKEPVYEYYWDDQNAVTKFTAFPVSYFYKLTRLL